MRTSIAVLFVIAIAAVRPVGAQRMANLTIGIKPDPLPSETHSLVLHSRASDDQSSAGPYVVIGALVGAGLAGWWEARAISRNGDDFAGTGGLLWIPPAAGAVLGAFGGWLIFKIVHSTPSG